jgi:sulfide:quinone oxidoreductase
MASTRVLIAGAGIAAVECVLALRELAGMHAGIELLAPAAELVHRPSSVKTPFGGAAAPRIDLTRLAAELGLRLHRDALASVESESHHALTRDGSRLPYDLLVVATGARSREAVPGAVTFRGPMSAGLVEQVVARVAAHPELRLAFAAPPGARWLLPLYELALLSAASLRDRGVAEPDIVVVTSEHEPLEVFGPAASEAVRAALDRAGVDLVTSAGAAAALEGALKLQSGGLLAADAVIALPELLGPHIAGLPHDDDGFLPVDEHGHVRGCADVFAAGDATAFPIKHGGVAAQQADAVAETIAAGHDRHARALPARAAWSASHRRCAAVPARRAGPRWATRAPRAPRPGHRVTRRTLVAAGQGRRPVPDVVPRERERRRRRAGGSRRPRRA